MEPLKPLKDQWISFGKSLHNHNHNYRHNSDHELNTFSYVFNECNKISFHLQHVQPSLALLPEDVVDYQCFVIFYSQHL